MNEQQKTNTIKDLIKFREVVCEHLERLDHDEKDSEVDWKLAYTNLNKEAFNFSNTLTNSLHLDNHKEYEVGLKYKPVKWKILDTDNS